MKFIKFGDFWVNTSHIVTVGMRVASWAPSGAENKYEIALWLSDERILQSPLYNADEVATQLDYLLTKINEKE